MMIPEIKNNGESIAHRILGAFCASTVGTRRGTKVAGVTCNNIKTGNCNNCLLDTYEVTDNDAAERLEKLLVLLKRGEDET